MKGATIATFIIEILSIYLNTMTFPLIIRIMGIFLGIIGDIVFIASVLTMKDSWRAGVSYEEKTDLSMGNRIWENLFESYCRK